MEEREDYIILDVVSIYQIEPFLKNKDKLNWAIIAENRSNLL